MTDIANLGFDIDTAPLDRTKDSLDRLAPAAANAVTATERLEQTFSGAGGAANAAAAGMQELNTTSRAAAGGIASTSVPISRWSVGLHQLDAQVVAYRAHLLELQSVQTRTAAGFRLTANEGLNMARQVQDIGVTLAMGMNPFMVAVQQGPQVFDVLSVAAQRTGMTVGAVFRAMAAQALAFLAPFLVIIGVIATIGATIAAGFALGARAINQHAGNIQNDLKLTKEQMDRLRVAGTDTAVTLGDTFHAFIDTVTSRLSTAFQGPLSGLASLWSTTMDAITHFAIGAVSTIIGAFIAAPRVIGAVWHGMPGLIGEGVINAANVVLAVIEQMINQALNRFNLFLQVMNQITGLAGGNAHTFGQLGQISLPRLVNPNAGVAASMASAVSAGIHQGLEEGRRDTEGFLSEVGARARERRNNRVLGAAGRHNTEGGGGRHARGAHARAASGHSQDELFGELVKGATRDIATQQQRAQADAISHTAQETAALEYQTRLLNEAQQKGITLTPAQTTEIKRLADAYATARVAADNAHSLHEILIGSDRQLAALRAAHDMIGLYGRDLAYATEMQRLLNEAQQKGMTPEAIAAARPQFEARANSTADQQTTNAHDQTMEDMRRQSAEAVAAAQAEAVAVRMGTDAATSYRIEQEMLAKARQANIDLTPADVASIHAAAQAQGDAVNATRHLTENIAFARDTTHGFFSDMMGNLRQGQSLWDAFANAAIGAINKIVDRLLDSQIDQLLNQIFSGGQGGGGGGGIANILGNLLSGGGGSSAAVSSGASSVASIFAAVAGGFAKGDAFSNNVFSKPTMFAYGQGKIGIMGEAGDEAVMPLTRGPDGSLGVQAHGVSGGGGGTVVHASITIQNDNRVDGAMSSRDIVELQKRSAEATKREISRQIPALIQQHQQDGAMV